MSDFDKDYAKRKLHVLLRDLRHFNAGEFWREMSRVASGATGTDHAEQLQQRNGELAAALERLTNAADKLAWEITHDENAPHFKSFGPMMDVMNESPQQCLAEHDANLIESASVPKHAKAGCIGEFNFTIENGLCCPQCWHEKDDECDLCHGASEEGGYSDRLVAVPWDTCKRIWQAMNKIKAEEIREEYAQRIKDGES